MKKIELTIGLKNGNSVKKIVNAVSLEDAMQECRWIMSNCPKVIVVVFCEFGSKYIIERW